MQPLLMRGGIGFRRLESGTYRSRYEGREWLTQKMSCNPLWVVTESGKLLGQFHTLEDAGAAIYAQLIAQ